MNSFVIAIALSVLAHCLAAPTATTTSSGSTSQCRTESLEEAKKAELALAKFAINIYKNITARKGDQEQEKNQVISPISIATALALLENGADGETRREIQKHLIQTEASEDVLSVYHALHKNLQYESKEARLQLANGIFVDNRIQLRPEYQQSTEQCMDAKVQRMEFQKKPEEARKQINQWVSEKTKNKIPELFQQGSVNAETLVALANAIHFKAPWMNPFSEEQTQKGVFYNQRMGKEEQQQQVQYMKHNGNFGHYADDRMQLLEMKYNGDVQAAMYVMLPNKRDGLRELEQELDAEKLKQILSKMTRAEVDVQLPKFAVRSTTDLTQLLQNMGFRNLFSDQADLSRMTEEKLHISAAVHQAFINVHENGTEAAAATGFTFTRSAMVGERTQFIADHPFLYAIIHQQTGAVLFIGKVIQVEQQE